MKFFTKIIEPKKSNSHELDSKFNYITNSLFVTPTYDAYLDNGTNIRLTVGISIIPLILSIVNTQAEIQIRILIYLYFLIYSFH